MLVESARGTLLASRRHRMQDHSVGINDLRTLLDRIQSIRHACDLDLLLFFFRHPCALLTTDQIVAALGYDRDRIAGSLDGLIDAGLLTRSQQSKQAAGLYMVQLCAGPDGLLSSLLEIAATRPGRQQIMRLLEPPLGRTLVPQAGPNPAL